MHDPLHEIFFEPHRYYNNITSNTLVVVEAMAAHGVKTLIYSSTCATYGEPEKMPITEKTPQVRVHITILCIHFRLAVPFLDGCMSKVIDKGRITLPPQLKYAFLYTSCNLPLFFLKKKES